MLGSPRRFKKLCERIQVAILRPFLLMDKRSQNRGPLMSSDDMLNYHSNGDTDRLTPTQIVITKDSNGCSSSSGGSNNLLGDSSDNESDDDLLNE